MVFHNKLGIHQHFAMYKIPRQGFCLLGVPFEKTLTMQNLIPHLVCSWVLWDRPATASWSSSLSLMITKQFFSFGLPGSSAGVTLAFVGVDDSPSASSQSGTSGMSTWGTALSQQPKVWILSPVSQSILQDGCWLTEILSSCSAFELFYSFLFFCLHL